MSRSYRRWFPPGRRWKQGTDAVVSSWVRLSEAIFPACGKASASALAGAGAHRGVDRSLESHGAVHGGFAARRWQAKRPRTGWSLRTSTSRNCSQWGQSRLQSGGGGGGSRRAIPLPRRFSTIIRR